MLLLCCALLLSHSQLFGNLWTAAHQASLSMGFSSQEWVAVGVGCCVLLQGIFPTQGLNLNLLCLLHWQVGSLPLAPSGKPHWWTVIIDLLREIKKKTLNNTLVIVRVKEGTFSSHFMPFQVESGGVLFMSKCCVKWSQRAENILSFTLKYSILSLFLLLALLLAWHPLGTQ